MSTTLALQSCPSSCGSCRGICCPWRVEGSLVRANPCVCRREVETSHGCARSVPCVLRLDSCCLLSLQEIGTGVETLRVCTKRFPCARCATSCFSASSS